MTYFHHWAIFFILNLKWLQLKNRIHSWTSLVAFMATEKKSTMLYISTGLGLHGSGPHIGLLGRAAGNRDNKANTLELQQNRCTCKYANCELTWMLFKVLSPSRRVIQLSFNSPQHKHWPTGPEHFSDRRASTDQYIVSFTGPAGPPS